MSYILTTFTVVCLVAWLIDRRRVASIGYQRGYDTAVVDCQIKRGQADRARREHNGQWKKKGAKA